MQKRKGSAGNTLGQIVRAARRAKRLTLREIADAAGVVHGFIADIELGRRNASASVLDKIAAAVEIDPRILHRASDVIRLRTIEAKAAELRRAAR